MEKILCASMMCANFDHLADEVCLLDKAGIDIFHCDIMDGDYVPNMTMGLNDLRVIKKNTKKMVDCHLMVKKPNEKIELFINAGSDLIYIHPDADPFPEKTIQTIHNANRLAGIAINPDVSLDEVKDLLLIIDYVLVMTVYPGFAGQKYIDSVTSKINDLIQLNDKKNFKVIVDGACSPQVIRDLYCLGVDGFVLGTSALFGKNASYSSLIHDLRRD